MASGAELLRQIKESVKEVDPRDVHDIVNNGYDAFVVDVREQEEFDQGTIDAPDDTGRKSELRHRVAGDTSDLAAQYEYGHHGKSPEPEEDQK